MQSRWYHEYKALAHFELLFLLPIGPRATILLFILILLIILTQSRQRHFQFLHNPAI